MQNCFSTIFLAFGVCHKKVLNKGKFDASFTSKFQKYIV